jgi:uncharacterized protein YjbJ (UPF0337 family)
MKPLLGGFKKVFRPELIEQRYRSFFDTLLKLWGSFGYGTSPLHEDVWDLCHSATRRKQMNTSTKDEIKGTAHEVKGKVKETAGKVTNNPNLQTEGNVEKNTGKVQKKVGQIEKVFEE